MDVILIHPGHAPELCDVSNDLAAFQHAVGGYIETVTLPDSGLVVIVNEDGRWMGLPANGKLLLRPLQHELLVGPVLICRASGEDLAPVRLSDLELVRNFWRPAYV